MIMERKVGEIFEYNCEWYQCVEQPKQYDCATVCELCSFNVIGNCDLDKCSGTYRSDKKSVIFKKLEKVGEPFKSMGNCYQVYKTYCEPTNVGLGSSYDGSKVVIKIKQNKENMEEKKLTYEELEHYYDSTCGLWAIDRDPKQVTLEWIVENAFQLGDTIPEKVCASNLKPFDLEAAKAGKLVCTRDGRKARIISFDRHGEDCPIIALVPDSKNAECEEVIDYTLDGICNENIINHNKYDLMMFTRKKEGWLNIFKDFEDTVCCVYPTEKEALEDGEIEKDYITTIKIEWEE